MGGNQFTYGVQSTAGGRRWSIASGNGERLFFLRTSGLAECAKAVNKTNLGRRLLMLTCMKPKLLRLQKSSKESLGNRSGARHYRAWIHLYITRGKEEE